jgi:hypothetical protein
VEAIIMNPSSVFNGSPELDYEGWRDVVRRLCGRYNPEGIEPNAFTGSIRPVSIFGFATLDLGCNAARVERTYRDTRPDGADHYASVFQVAGRSTMTQNDQTLQLAVGDVVLEDAAHIFH